MFHTYLRFLQLATGALIAFFLGTHMVIMHLPKILGFFGIEIHKPTSWESMMKRAQENFLLVFYILFLAFALYHALNGLRGIILELSPSSRTKRVITGLIIILGLITFALGSYVPVALFRS